MTDEQLAEQKLRKKRSHLKAERTIRSMIFQLQATLNKLPPRSQDQSYGAIEALRWVVGLGPSMKHFACGMGK